MYEFVSPLLHVNQVKYPTSQSFIKGRRRDLQTSHPTRHHTTNYYTPHSTIRRLCHFFSSWSQNFCPFQLCTALPIILSTTSNPSVLNIQPFNHQLQLSLRLLLTLARFLKVAASRSQSVSEAKSPIPCLLHLPKNCHDAAMTPRPSPGLGAWRSHPPNP